MKKLFLFFLALSSSAGLTKACGPFEGNVDPAVKAQSLQDDLEFDKEGLTQLQEQAKTQPGLEAKIGELTQKIENAEKELAALQPAPKAE